LGTGKKAVQMMMRQYADYKEDAPWCIPTDFTERLIIRDARAVRPNVALMRQKGVEIHPLFPYLLKNSSIGRDFALMSVFLRTFAE